MTFIILASIFLKRWFHSTSNISVQCIDSCIEFELVLTSMPVWLMQRSDAVGLVVIDEEDNQTLLVHRISADDIYRRQEGIPIFFFL
jgi:hypothetical protein